MAQKRKSARKRDQYWVFLILRKTIREMSSSELMEFLFREGVLLEPSPLGRYAFSRRVEREEEEGAPDLGVDVEKVFRGERTVALEEAMEWSRRGSGWFVGNLSDLPSADEPRGGVYEVFLYDIDQQHGPEMYWRCEFKIVDGRHANRSIFVNISLSPAARWKVREFFEAFGIDCSGDIEVQLVSLVGKKIRVFCKQEKFEDLSRLRIKKFLRPKKGWRLLRRLRSLLPAVFRKGLAQTG